MKNGKKMIASALFFAMAAGCLGGCALFDKDDEGVLGAAKDYADAVVSGDAGDIADLLKGGDEDDIAEYMSAPDAAVDEYDDIVDAILGTISYEIDEETVESSKKQASGSVDITWTIVDYEQIFDDVTADGGDADDYISALTASGADTNEISKTMNLVLEDGTWLISDKKNKNLYSLYSFYEFAGDIRFAPPLADYVDYTLWYFSDANVYTNESQIELDIIPTAGEGNEIEWEFYYEYYLDGSLVFTSDTCTDQGSYIEAYYSSWYDSSASTDDNGYLVPGQYRCVIYDMAGNVLADSTCTVEVEVYEAPAEVAYEETVGFYTTDIERVTWWGSSDGVYYNPTRIELDIIPVSDAQDVEWNFTYQYYLDGELIYTSDEWSDQGYYIESYYGTSYDDNARVNENGYLVSGEYSCIVYDLDGNLLADGTCLVSSN